MKKLASFILALALCMGLAVPAFAAGEYRNVMIFHIDEDYTEATGSLELVEGNSYNEHTSEKTVDKWYVLKPGTALTLKNPGSDAGVYGYLYLQEYSLQSDGKYFGGAGVAHLTTEASPWAEQSNAGNGLYWEWDALFAPYWDENPEEYYAGILYSGESITVQLPDGGKEDVIYKVYWETYYPDIDRYYYSCAYFMVADTGSTPIAYASTQNVLVDGKSIEFQCYALKDENGYMTNYIKLRDVASVLNGTAAQFNVGWNGNVNIETGKAYVPNGSEMSTPFSGDRAYENATATTNVNGKAANLNAILLKDDIGSGFTYYKLRDLGNALGFKVDWSAQKGIFIETK